MNVASTLKQKNDESTQKVADSVLQDTFVHRPMVLRGRTYRIQTPVGEAFVTINRDEQDRPFEVFMTVGRGGMHTMADAEAMGRLVSMSLRLARSASNVDPMTVAKKIIHQLRGIGGASHVGFGKDRVMSLADAIAKVLAEDLAQTNQVSQPVEQAPLNLTIEESLLESSNGYDAEGQLGLGSQIQADLWPECGNAPFVMEEGCKKCHSCGYSMC